jgi:hypothetical protein
MFRGEDFEDIRPFLDQEINPALQRIIAEPGFDKITDFFFTGQDHALIRQKLSAIHTVDGFQRSFMYPLVKSILAKSSKGLSSDGFGQLTPGTSYLFVANHRDIVLDSAILQVLLYDHDHFTSEITFGSNLMINKFVIDWGKVNRMFKVEREGNRMDLFRNAQKLSGYLRYAITEKKVSVWIAQRSGRTKNGSDKTEAALLKMFNMSGYKEFNESFKELNIVPLVISYEYEPCCAFKIKELIETEANGTYKKKPGEDLTSITTGITQQKGRIHMSVGTPVNELIQLVDAEKRPNNKISKLAEIIDNEVYRHYKMWPNNFIAYDLLFECNYYKDIYSSLEKEEFLNYMQDEISNIEGNKKKVTELFLGIYANPLVNLNRIT